MEPEKYTPGEGKTSSKPSFSGSMLIFGGVYVIKSSRSLNHLEGLPQKGVSYYQLLLPQNDLQPVPAKSAKKR